VKKPGEHSVQYEQSKIFKSLKTQWTLKESLRQVNVKAIRDPSNTITHMASTCLRKGILLLRCRWSQSIGMNCSFKSFWNLSEPIDPVAFVYGSPWQPILGHTPKSLGVSARAHVRGL
jgi:hypothetical protein